MSLDVSKDGAFDKYKGYRTPLSAYMAGERNGIELKQVDANGDGTVNVSDIVLTVNYIMGNPAPNFNKEAADLNGDGEINVTDIVKMVNIIMEATSRREDRR